jgi:hypothetical protein
MSNIALAAPITGGGGKLRAWPTGFVRRRRRCGAGATGLREARPLCAGVAPVRVLKALARRGVVRVSLDVLEVDDALAERDPVLAQLATAAVAGLPAPSGPRACHTCPCPTRLRRARHPRARPSAGASPRSWSHVAGLRSSGISWCKTAALTCTRRPTRVPSGASSPTTPCSSSLRAHAFSRLFPVYTFAPVIK